MKIRNVTADTVVINDQLSQSGDVQYQPGLKSVTIAAGDTVVVPNAYAAESPSIQGGLASGYLTIVGTEDEVGGLTVPGLLMGKGTGPAFMGIVKTDRLEVASNIHRIMFGAPVAGDEVVDEAIYGYDVAATADVIVSADAAANLSGTMTNAKTVAAVSGNVIVTFTGSAITAQAGYSIFAKHAV